MKHYLAYWKRGWWALGLLISINVILGVVYAVIAFLLRPLLGNHFPLRLPSPGLQLARRSPACSSRSSLAGASEWIMGRSFVPLPNKPLVPTRTGEAPVLAAQRRR
jgi:hypothetical protein